MYRSPFYVNGGKDKEMRIKVNGIERDVGSRRLGDILKELNVDYTEGCAIAIISEMRKEVTNEFRLKTPAGDARIKIEDGSEAVSAFLRVYSDFRGEYGRVSWKNDEVTAIGPVSTEMRVERGRYSYAKWDVFLGMGGYDPRITYLCICKKAHEAAYGAPDGGVIGRITRGKSIIMKLKEGDEVEISPVEAGVEEKGFVTTDMSTEIHDGEEIYTEMHIKMLKEAPMSCEHFFSLTRRGIFDVDEVTNTFIASSGLKGLNLPEENIGHRTRYLITVRNTGTERGKVYIYKEDRLSTPFHNVLGEIEKGHSLVKFARKGDKIRVETTPRWMMVVGKTQKEAEEFLAREGISQVRDGKKDDDAVVVEQDPDLTMDVIEKGSVTTYGVSPESVLPVKLFRKEAPKTVWYFRKVTGMVTKPIGRLKVFFTVPGMIVLFEGQPSEAGLLVPENPPKGVVERGVLGVTNMAKTNRGVMGIRLEESTEYGPTGEPFENTNIVLKIHPFTDEVAKTLSRLKEGDVIYVREVE